MSAIGQRQSRKEDFRFLTGRGTYTADMAMDDTARAIFVRAPVAFGRISLLDVEAARACPGVLAVLTGADANADGLGHIPTTAPVQSHDGSPMKDARRPVLPTDRVHHVGQPVAIIVAETMAAARDAADLVELDIDEAAPALNGATAPQIHAGIPDNLAFDWREGDWPTTEAAIQAAPHQVSVTFRQNRMAAAPIEGRVALAAFEAGDSPSVTLHLACQGAHLAQRVLSKVALNWPSERLRVKVGDVGGGFGPKFFLYPEQACVAWACWRLQRAVLWDSERTESFVSEAHARDQLTRATLGFDAGGRFTGITMDADADMGAFLSTAAPAIPTDGMAKVITGLYTIPTAALRVRGLYSNTVPVDAYRGAGKPPGVYCLERLVDMAAAKLGMDPAEIRRRNLIAPDQLPWTTGLGRKLDGGSTYPASLEQVLGHADHAGFAARKADSAARGLWRGFGLCCNLHGIGGSATETSIVTVDAGRITAWTGTQSTGQGHETVYAQVLAERLGLPIDMIDVRQGDTDVLARGGGTGGSSSTVISSNTLARTADRVLDQARDRAAEHLETAAGDLEYAAGRFTVVGTDRQVSLFDLAVDTPIRAEHDFEETLSAFPYGTIAAEVEVDPATGKVTLVGMTTCDDAGRMVNPMLLEGQSQGALVQGAGQALMEHLVYDPDSGQVLAGSFMDYAMPRAADLPAIDTHFIETETPNNMLGIRGIGELGTNGAPVAVANAVFDALAHMEGVQVEPPFTPDRVWRAIRAASGPHAD